MIPRYTRPEMARIWSDENRFRTWLAVEVAATETLAEAGLVPKEAAKAIKERADFRVERIHEIEAEVRHDVIAFTTAVAEDRRSARPLVPLRTHLQRRRRHRAGPAHSPGVPQVIAQDLHRLAKCWSAARGNLRHAQIGRTHGIHAEPITFGLKIANWYSETQRNIARFAGRGRRHARGQVFGAVGNLRAPHTGTGRNDLRAPGTEGRCRFRRR